MISGTKAWWWTLLWVAAVAATLFAAQQRLFSSFAPYDDEGYVLLSLQTSLQGRALYDEIYTQYGPAYYAVHGLFHGVTSLPVTHDIARFKTMIVWVGAALLCAAYVHRVTQLRVLTFVAFLVSYFHLDRLGVEAAHPQDLCLLALVGTLYATTYLRFPSDTGGARAKFTKGLRRQRIVLCVMGILTAVALMVKVNVGVFLAAGSLLGLLLVTEHGRWQRVACCALIGAILILPWLVARQHAFGLVGHQLPVVVSVAVGMVAWTGWQLPHRRFLSKVVAIWYMAALAIVASVFCVWAWWHGTSLGGLAHGLVGQHLGFVDVFYEHPPVYLPAAICALATAAFGVVAWRGNTTMARLFYLALVVAVVGISLRHLTDTYSPITHGANDRGQAALLISFFTPLVWIVLLPYREGQGPHDPSLARGLLPRLLLCTIAVLQPLMVYPIPGTQMAVGSLPLLLAVLVGVGDCLRIPGLLGDGERTFRRVLVASLVGLATITIACRDVHLWRQRTQLVPLNLAGAKHLCLPADFVARKRWTVARLQQHADTFLCLQNGHNSLYLWSGLRPPTGWNTTLWQDLLNDQQQYGVIRALRRHRRVCVVVDRAEPPPHRRNRPLARFITRWFEPVYRHGTTEIWMPRVHCISPT
jgi:hypothetical protein